MQVTGLPCAHMPDWQVSGPLQALASSTQAWPTAQQGSPTAPQARQVPPMQTVLAPHGVAPPQQG